MVDSKKIGVAVGITAGLVVGICALPALFTVVGLTAIGPIAGGLFAANSGAAIAAGSAMAVTQSMAMGGSVMTASAITTGVGAVASSVLGSIGWKIG